MTSVAPNQFTLNFEAALPDRFRTLREYLGHRVAIQPKPAKVIAADMDMSPSLLSRKLSPGDGDTQRFNIDDLELYIEKSGDCAAVVEYLIAKYMDSPEARKQRVLAKVETMLPEILAALQTLKQG